jgi:2-dehydro-3-deoxyphosphogluconate aldolase/(4S)-4-hydroxy-2-oxoglutarate aldolase
MRRPRSETVAALEALGAVAVVRLEDTTQLRPIIDALVAGGVRALEITMTMHGALDAIAESSAALEGSVLLGAGTVLDAETARLVISAGARFVVGPTFCADMVRACHRYDVVAIPGAYTPTEIAAAWEAGADLVKVFPASSLGPSYLRELLGPLPRLRLMPTGGVTTENAGAFLAAGAAVVGVGSALVDHAAVARGDYAQITERARQLSEIVRAARARSS